MINFILILIISFSITVFITPLVIRISFKKRALDFPYDKSLQIHHNPVPVLGGISISMGIISSFLLITFLYRTFQQEMAGVLLAILIVLSIGLFDDIKEIKPSTKLCGQFVASLLIIFMSKITVNLIPY